MFLKILIVFVIIFILFPQLVLRFRKNEYSMLDRFLIGFTAIIACLITIVHMLVLIKLYDVISLTACIVVLSVIYIKTDKERLSVVSKLLSRTIRLYDVLESRKGFVKTVRDSFAGIGRRVGHTLKNAGGIAKEPVLFATAAAVFTASFFVRLYHSFVHTAYPHIDMYLHLKWIKQLSSNTLYYVGQIYPKGMHSVYSALAKITFIDPYWIFRFLGPFFCGMIVVAVYYTALKITENKYAALFSAAVYGLTKSDLFPSVLFRQTASLTQEFALLFSVLGLAFLIEYLKNKNSRYILYYLISFFISTASHNISGMYLALWSAIVVTVAFCAKRIPFREAFRMALYTGGALFAGYLPILIGLIAGLKFHQSSIAVVTEGKSLKLSLISVTSFLKQFIDLGNPYMFLMFVMLVISIIAIICSLHRSDPVFSFSSMALMAALLVTYMIYLAPGLFIKGTVPEILDKSRIGPFLAPLLAIFFSIFLQLVYCFFSNTKDKQNSIPGKMLHHSGLAVSIFYIVFLICAGCFPTNLYYLHQEYDASARNYLAIKSEFYGTDSTGDWLLVATDPQLSETMGYGQYEESYKFVQDYTAEEAGKPDFKFNLNSHNIFIYVEKKPLFYNKSISVKDAGKELSPLQSGDDAFMKYYQSAENRALMEAKNWAIAESYRAAHNGVSIYYEDKDLIIYRIYQKDLSHIKS